MNTEIESEGKSCTKERIQTEVQSEASAETHQPSHFRRLRFNELVGHGDFVRKNRREFEPWKGPGGFRADAFVKPIYRRQKNRPIEPKNIG